MRINTTIAAAVALAVAAGTMGRIAPDGRSASAADKPAKAEVPLKFGEEKSSPDEAQVIEEMAALQVETLLDKAKEAKADPRRGQHAKHHGCVDADFTVLTGVPKDYQVGLFKTPKSYPCKVRFSNGGLDDDTKSDVHGMAVKVMLGGTPPVVQDFVLIDSRIFFAPDAKTVLELMKASKASKTDPMAMANFAKTNGATFDRVVKSKRIIKTSSPLAESYWSTVPFRLGEYAVKYEAGPVGIVDPTPAPGGDPNYLGKAMVQRLAAGQNAVTFELRLIPKTDSSMDIEDPTKPWTSSPVPVARITIKPQVFNSEKQMKACEDAEFHPWNALPEHLPLGGINRARKAVYEASSAARHK